MHESIITALTKLNVIINGNLFIHFTSTETEKYILWICFMRLVYSVKDVKKYMHSQRLSSWTMQCDSVTEHVTFRSNFPLLTSLSTKFHTPFEMQEL